jgi:hypothetical protein
MFAEMFGLEGFVVLGVFAYVAFLIAVLVRALAR